MHPEKAGLAEVGGAELRGHTRDADVVGVAGNPGVGPWGRSLQAGGPGSCGVTYKLSVVFVWLPVNSQLPLPPAMVCNEESQKQGTHNAL